MSARATRSGSEVEWSSVYGFMKERGYTLRPRYHPDWEALWDSNELSSFSCEDRIVQRHAFCLDATGLDGTPVYIKKVDRRKHPSEAAIAEFLSSSTMMSDSYNHTVPILDSFAYTKDPDIYYLVMPLLRRFDDPPFTTIKESVDFVYQTLQGLTFMHEHNVAHRDCSAQNIMMDARDLYPNGWHPMSPWLTPDVKGFVHPRKNRCDANIKYFFIDFGLSTRFAPGESHLVVGAKGAAAAPELSREVSYNPFKLDVYLLGKVFQQHICQPYDGVPFLDPLMKDMTAFRPDDRPTAKDALKRWQDICESNQASSMRRWLHKRGESASERLARDIILSAIYGYTKLTSA
ncbi:kinase-like domain-containing protein [Phlebopus sp. FC_14]|nr:kinase-like domain-containing protein [Phlebopus sp. FC_14]